MSEWISDSDWYQTLPEVDHKWVSETFFSYDSRGRAHMHTERINKLWWDPPHPSIARQGKPSISQYFGHRLFLWMPRKLWRIQLKCPQPGCRNIDLTSAGIHKKTRQVIDVAGSYNIASETLVCQKCKRKVLAWSHNIITHLDIGHQIQFPCIWTAMKACDIKVVRLLRQRGLGNSSTQQFHAT